MILSTAVQTKLVNSRLQWIPVTDHKNRLNVHPKPLNLPLLEDGLNNDNTRETKEEQGKSFFTTIAIPAFFAPHPTNNANAGLMERQAEP